ncbi:CDP-alcohol phosphatidyltransferase family protein [Neorickettsia sennetsu]|uniref:CDP-diacylglycerol--serine O-phosphatidyltransferase n=1 Tax=Ehrlichia sennetsu (strain ATCC VR-367 / Miyayama) TaxID=222891 RepID=Q2GEF5_EHRS3|nr:phosphatidylcholine/phosphatidylserine synthase [Neorickettsia sennetsu]ABD46166.1 putative CDP-diacylglycerol--serine O-phosphatidyltransferase [Neorickettsia sennetsu str. Miyayama]
MKSRSVPITRFFPNFITFCGLCLGLTSIRFSLIGRWELAIGAIVIAAIMDGIDGRLARMFESSSNFGAELDSLADMVSFGVAPAFMLYLWELHNIRVFGWGITMVFVVCMAVRLARFNVTATLPGTDGELKKFFYGVPAPAGGILAVLPVILIFASNNCSFVVLFATEHYFLLGYLSVISMLTVSSIPTFSLKNVAVPHYLESALIFLFVTIAVALILKPWLTISVLALCYICSMPLSCFTYSKR